ncbi:protein GDAP2-like protein [Corchorus olitorius]|uniref:Protein GDAP2-like protein n=1 Tax=Corchorus olitorius TaxID=93759 RepID=A0A1R3IUJ8_9ROSI|nr:protein GDAP2-like protein [Corchorus olitorius]
MKMIGNLGLFGNWDCDCGYSHDQGGVPPDNVVLSPWIKSHNGLMQNLELDEAHSSPGLQAAAGPGLVEECATLVC